MSRKKNSIRYIIMVFFLTFVIASALASSTEAILHSIPVTLTWILLLVVIGIGVVFDIIGIAVAAASEAPHHARAAKKVFGARQSIYLIKRADRVANFANDIVGDITGTVSGAMGATIIISLVSHYGEIAHFKVLLNTFMLALIASLTVAGKAWGKTIAINEADRIMDLTGRFIATFEKITGLDVTRARKRGGR